MGDEEEGGKWSNVRHLHRASKSIKAGPLATEYHSTTSCLLSEKKKLSLLKLPFPPSKDKI